MSEFIPIAVRPQSAAPQAFNVEALNADLRNFTARYQARIAAAAATPAPGTVVVEPGGNVYNSISAAIAATTPDPQAWPVLYVGPGTYNEQVVLKEYMIVKGMGTDQTFITFTGPDNPFQKGTVVAATHSAISNCTIKSNGNGWGTWACGIDCGGAVPFGVDNCIIQVTDNGQEGINMIAVSVDYNAHNPGNSRLQMSYCSVSCVAAATNYPIALTGFGGAYAQALTCKFTASAPNGWSWGVSSALGSNIQLVDSYAAAQMWSLVINQLPSTLVATKCQTIGPVGEGVIIQN